MRVEQRRTRSGLIGLFVLLPILVWALLARSATPAITASSTPAADPEASPMSEATVDDVTIGLMTWQQDPSTPGRWIATIRATSAAGHSARFVADLISLTSVTRGNEVTLTPLPESTLPCTLQPGDSATITLLFQLEPGHTAVSLTIGLEEENRSGAQVVFPLGTGATSATGGDGAAGADAIGGDATGADAAAPGSPATPVTPAGQSSPAAGSCAD